MRDPGNHARCGCTDVAGDSMIEMERYAALLEGSGDYRVLRRLRPASAVPPLDAAIVRHGIYLDVETTGLDPATDGIVELAMLSFDYSADGGACLPTGAFAAFRDPGRPISPEASALTGIDDAMVAGRSIDVAQVSEFVRHADLIVAHNAAFDRAFCERFSDVFAGKPWACSYREIDWKSEGFDGARLMDLAHGHGLFFGAHRALDDCRAGLEIISRPLPRSGRTALAALLESARRPRWPIRALGASYDARVALKSRGYRWNAGSDRAQRCWYVDVDEAAIGDESEFLRREIYRRPDAVIDMRRFTAFERYSERCGWPTG